jgi:hypothetical protein
VKRAADLAIVLALLLAACGDGDKKTPDAGMQPMADASPDAPGETATLTSYVIDMITNGTSGTAAARPFSEFQALPDPDTANAAAYSSLF